MQMRNQKKVNRKLKKSQLLLLGSLLVFAGCCLLTKNYLVNMKNEVFSEMKVDSQMNGIVSSDKDYEDYEDVTDVPITNNLPESTSKEEQVPQPVIDYSKYLGVLEIPKIGLKRGFYNIDSRYNNVEYNVTMVKGSTLPDVVNGNLILMAHSGWAEISYFQNLYRLKVGDSAYVTYNGNKYGYKLVNIYDVEKNGKVKIVRSYNKTTLTLITCTVNDDTKQTVYILELV